MLSELICGVRLLAGYAARRLPIFSNQRDETGAD